MRLCIEHKEIYVGVYLVIYPKDMYVFSLFRVFSVLITLVPLIPYWI